MNELLEKEQIVSVVPQDFRNAIKGKVVSISDKFFEVETTREPEGILINNLIEFYSQTQHGILYFASDITSINGNTLKVLAPVKHRFLQRRKFTRINFSQELELKSATNQYVVTITDLSAGGLKIKSSENVDIDQEYDVKVSLSDELVIKCKFQPIRIEKNDKGVYTLSGRFTNLNNTDRMTLIQLCMKKKIENVSK